MTSLDYFARVEVKTTLELGGWLWIGAADGLLRWRPGARFETARPVPGWDGVEVQALAAASADAGLIAAIYGADGPFIVFCDAEGQPLSRIAPPLGEKVKTMAASGDALWIGTKRGVYRYDAGTWRLSFGQDGRAEMLRVWRRDDGTLAGSVKKLAPDDRPALIESTDGGESWTVQRQSDYQDLVLAADHGLIITRWRGARPAGEPAGYKKHPITAGLIAADGTTAVVDGDKLEIAPPPGREGAVAKMSAYHPAIAEAERAHLVPGGAVVAGAQGAWLFEPATGALRDLMPPPSFAAGRPGKLKRLFLLDGVLLATTGFGTFRSFDDGESWERADSEWWVLDAEHAARGAGGRWWIACQRGLFRTDDRGGRIDYHKIKVDGPHYAELRALAVAGRRVALGTKQGLFVNLPAEDDERFVRVEAFGPGVVEVAAWDPAGAFLYVGGADGRLWRWDMASSPQLVAELPVGEGTLLADDGVLRLVCGGRISEIRGRTVRDITPPDAQGGLHMIPAGDRLLAWDERAAWTRPRRGGQGSGQGGSGQGEQGGGWTAIAGWPAGVRHVAVDPARGLALATDRAAFFRIAL